MKGEIKIAYAEHDGKLIHISQVESGLSCKYVCPVCKEPAVARKEKRKGSREWWNFSRSAYSRSYWQMV